jgi:putative transposase
MWPKCNRTFGHLFNLDPLGDVDLDGQCLAAFSINLRRGFAGVRQAWELDDADKAEKLLRNLAQRLERDWSGVSGSILEGIDEILTVTRLRLPKELRRSLACTNIIENVMGTVRRVCRNVKRWRSASMAMRWTAAAMQEAAKGFRRLKAHKQLPALRAALQAHQTRHSARGVLARQANAA